MDDLETERTAFEAWVREELKLGSVWLARSDRHDGYVWTSTQLAWRAWTRRAAIGVTKMGPTMGTAESGPQIVDFA